MMKYQRLLKASFQSCYGRCIKGFWLRLAAIQCNFGFFVARFLKNFFAVSYATKSALICSGVKPEKIHVVHNPLDVEDIVKRSQEPLHAELPQLERPVRLLVPAAIQPQKNF